MAKPGSNDAWRAAMVAGRAAHTGSREKSALDFYRAAEGFARDDRQSRNALWGQLMAASALELDEAQELLALLEATSSRSDQYELVRMADKKLGVDLRLGTMRAFPNARRVSDLWDTQRPVRSLFVSIFFAYALVLSATYREAYDSRRCFSRTRESSELTQRCLTRTSCLATRWRGLDAMRTLISRWTRPIRGMRRCNDGFGIQNVFASRMRILVQEGRAAEACIFEIPDLEHSVRAMRRRCLCRRAAWRLATTRRSLTRRLWGHKPAQVPRGLRPGSSSPCHQHALCPLKQRTSGTREALELLLLTAMDSGAVDLVVSAYRGNPDLLEAMLSSPGTREHTVHIMMRAW